MYTTHSPCWDAKNRFDLAPELPFDFGQIAHIFGDQPTTVSNVENVQPTVQPVQQTVPVQQNAPVQTVQPEPQEVLTDTDGFEDMAPRQLNIPDGIPKELAELMKTNDVDESDIRLVVSQRGYFTYDTPITTYPLDFQMGVLVGAWAQILPLIRENQAIPFTVGGK
jgi:hypothetical protein